MTNHKYKYIYQQDLIKNPYTNDDYVSLPLFFDFNFNDVKNNLISSKFFIDPFMLLYQEKSNEISEICFQVLGKKLLIKDSTFYLLSDDNKSSNLKNIEKLMIYTYYEISTNKRNFIIPLPSYNNVISDYFIFKQFLDSLPFINLSFIFSSNDIHLLSIFNTHILDHDIYWIEGEFDQFTYKFFMPEKEYKIAGNWSNIFKILEHKNKHHYGIIDKDGFLLENKKRLSFGEQIFFSKYSECENLWLSEDILNVFENNIKSFSKKVFMEEVISLSKADKEVTMQRFINRQDKLRELGYPYNNEDIVKNVINKYYKSINENNYNYIISYYDNKTIFNLLLKRISCKNIKMFYELMSKLKKEIIRLKINPII